VCPWLRLSLSFSRSLSLSLSRSLALSLSLSRARSLPRGSGTMKKCSQTLKRESYYMSLLTFVSVLMHLYADCHEQTVLYHIIIHTMSHHHTYYVTNKQDFVALGVLLSQR